jgi:serine acetyltransferase
MMTDDMIIQAIAAEKIKAGQLVFVVPPVEVGENAIIGKDVIMVAPVTQETSTNADKPASTAHAAHESEAHNDQ